jgi:hypothetical protein
LFYNCQFGEDIKNTQKTTFLLKMEGKVMKETKGYMMDKERHY